MATLCYQLSGSSNSGDRDLDVHARGTVLVRCTAHGNFKGYRFCVSSNCDNAGSSHPTFRRLLSSVQRKGITAIVAGSRSQLKHGRVRAKACVRVFFPRRNIHCVTVGSNCSSGRRSRVSVTPFQGVVGRVCTGSASQGVGDTLQAHGGDKGCVSDNTPFNCRGSPTSRGRLIVSPGATPIIRCVCSVTRRKLKLRHVTGQLRSRGILGPYCCGGRVFNHFVSSRGVCS